MARMDTLIAVPFLVPLPVPAWTTVKAAHREGLEALTIDGIRTLSSLKVQSRTLTDCSEDCVALRGPVKAASAL
jgi:hypothetical protein